MSNVLIKTQNPKSYAQSITADKFNFVSDAPKDIAKDSQGPDPHELVYAALGACTSMTMQMYAQRKGMNLESVEVSIDPVKEGSHELTSIRRNVKVTGKLSSEEIDMLARVADKCPIHKLLVKAIPIETKFETN